MFLRYPQEVIHFVNESPEMVLFKKALEVEELRAIKDARAKVKGSSKVSDFKLEEVEDVLADAGRTGKAFGLPKRFVKFLGSPDDKMKA